MHTLLIYILIVGLILGSFFNVIGLRVPKKQSIVAPSSYCPKCHHQLKALELIPVVSYLIQGGKCRQCKARINSLYPIVELMTGLLFFTSPLILGWSSELFIAWTLISLLMIIFVSDVTYMIIPDRVLLFFTLLFFIERLFIPLNPWWDSIVGAALGFVLLLFIAILSKGGMGGGDIKLYALLGLVLGTRIVLLSFFLAILFGTLFGIIGLATGKLKRKNPIPFGPFIGAGTLTAYFYGDLLLHFYLHLLKI